jgi:hypothetical protein
MLEVTLITDKNQLGYSGGTVKLTVTVRNTGDTGISFNSLKVNDLIYNCEGSTVLVNAFKALGITRIESNKDFVFYTSVTVPGYENGQSEGVNSYRIKIIGLNDTWVKDPHNEKDYIESGESTITINVLNIQLKVKSLYANVLGNPIGEVRYDELGNRRIYYSLEFINDSEFSLTDITISDSFSLKTKGGDECEYEYVIDNDPIPDEYKPSHTAFDLLKKSSNKSYSHTENYDVLLSPCEIGTLTDTVTITYKYERIERNTSSIVDSKGIKLFEDSINVTVTLTLTDFLVEGESVDELDIVTIVPEKEVTNHWASIDILKQISGFEVTHHLDRTNIHSILRKADLFVRDGHDRQRGVGVYHEKEELYGYVDGTNKEFCIKDGSLFPGFTFSDIPNHDDIRVFKRLACASTTSCTELCNPYIQVCVRCINKYGSIILDEAVTTDYELFADFYTYGGVSLYPDYENLKLIASTYAAHLVSHRLVDERKETTFFRASNTSTNYKNDAMAMLKREALSYSTVTKFDDKLKIDYY